MSIHRELLDCRERGSPCHADLPVHPNHLAMVPGSRPGAGAQPCSPTHVVFKHAAKAGPISHRRMTVAISRTLSPALYRWAQATVWVIFALEQGLKPRKASVHSFSGSRRWKTHASMVLSMRAPKLPSSHLRGLGAGVPPATKREGSACRCSA